MSNREAKKHEVDDIDFENFFKLKKKNLNVFNQYDLNKTLKRIENLKYDDIFDDLNGFQVKDLELRNYEDINKFTLDNVKFLTSSVNSEEKKDFYLLNDLYDYIIYDNDNKSKKKIKFKIQMLENGKKFIIIKIPIDGEKLSENILSNFLQKSSFKCAKVVNKRIKNILENKNLNFKLTIKIQINSLKRIYHNRKKGEYFLDLQSPPIFKTNFFIEEKDEENGDVKLIEENSLFPFRNFEDEISNLKYRHFIILLQKNINDENINNNNNNINNEDEQNYDTIEQFHYALGNLFKNRKGETSNKKFIKKKIELKNYEKQNDEKKNLKFFLIIIKIKMLKKNWKNYYF